MTIDISCPGCHLPDQVQSMRAIQATGVRSVERTARHSAIGFTAYGAVPVFGAATSYETHTSALAAFTAPEPTLRPTGCLVAIALALLLLVVPVLPGVFLITNAELEDPTNSTGDKIGTVLFAVFILFCAAIPALIALFVVALRTRYNDRIHRGRPAARALWDGGFYCHRCGGVYWPYPPPGSDVPARQLIAPREFQHMVWRAGRYIGL
ncbi:hypothetical protein [Nocardia sp. NPDC050175]|uniref:hypothetical protein n=1 Tax=Nocardia sp. NPDC050175 TaxID=3364317 RepID=UPI00378A27CB